MPIEMNAAAIAPGQQPRTGAPPWWVWLEREHADVLAIGPYANEACAVLAMQDSLLVDSFAEEDCLDCWVSDEQPAHDVEQVIIDPSNARHTGVGRYSGD